MATPTTNYGYQKGDDGENYDVELLNGNFDAIDSDIKEANGRIDDVAVGSLGLVNSAGTFSANGTEDRIDYLQYALKANRRYKIEYRHNCISTVANAPYAIQAKKASTGSTDASGTDLDDVSTHWSAAIANSGKTDCAVFYYKPSVNETVNIKITGYRLGGTSVTISLRKLIVIDLGLSGA